MKRQVTVRYYRSHDKKAKCGFQGCTSDAVVVERRTTFYKGMREFSHLFACRVHAEMLLGLSRLRSVIKWGDLK